jgi:hypothetical protein
MNTAIKLQSIAAWPRTKVANPPLLTARPPIVIITPLAEISTIAAAPAIGFAKAPSGHASRWRLRPLRHSYGPVKPSAALPLVTALNAPGNADETFSRPRYRRDGQQGRT